MPKGYLKKPKQQQQRPLSRLRGRARAAAQQKPPSLPPLPKSVSAETPTPHSDPPPQGRGGRRKNQHCRSPNQIPVCAGMMAVEITPFSDGLKGSLKTQATVGRILVSDSRPKRQQGSLKPHFPAWENVGFKNPTYAKGRLKRPPATRD